MSENNSPLCLPPFPLDYRASGLLLHVTSLPGPYGIGDVGPAALSWIDRLAQAGQRWWQSLPLGPTGYGNSPYQSLSSFAGNELLISPDWLIEDELLRASDCQTGAFPQDEVVYKAVIIFKQRLLEKAWTNFSAGARADLRSEYQQFLGEQSQWLEDYALFRVLKTKFNGAYYLEWPAEFLERDRAALERAGRELAGQIGQTCFAQFLLFRQGQRLKAHAHGNGVCLIGDLPFFVSPDSSDVWAHPELFLLGERRRPRVVAGVPPDYFSAHGQLWGNPMYDWAALRESGYRWCIARLKSLLVHVDAIRLDHFRGFSAAWHVPPDAVTAESGKWVAGPGADLFDAIEKELGALPFIAEDLGLITPDVYALRDKLKLPGMRILQFAFDGDARNPHLPGNYVSNAVVYTGTHDNLTTRNWFEELPERQRQIFWKYLGRTAGESREAAPALMGLAWSSVAAVSIAPLQDLLNLGREARMNVPGRADGNWAWRCSEDRMRDPAFESLRDLTKGSNRFPHTEKASSSSQPGSAGQGFRTPAAVL
ncbi:MAG: 4-alpha-glucanotransferase [Candidatus Acidiferrales bacterium]|jgi:4-alpha-glucanotransferase